MALSLRNMSLVVVTLPLRGVPRRLGVEFDVRPFDDEATYVPHFLDDGPELDLTEEEQAEAREATNRAWPVTLTPTVFVPVRRVVRR